MKKIPNEIKEEKEEVSKDWRDAFVETRIITKEQCVNYGGADCIKIMYNDNCTKYPLLCGYVAQFVTGGFWFSSDGLYFTTAGIDSDSEATYEDAKNYIKKLKTTLIKKTTNT